MKSKTKPTKRSKKRGGLAIPGNVYSHGDISKKWFDKFMSTATITSLSCGVDGLTVIAESTTSSYKHKDKKQPKLLLKLPFDKQQEASNYEVKYRDTYYPYINLGIDFSDNRIGYLDEIVDSKGEHLPIIREDMLLENQEVQKTTEKTLFKNEVNTQRNFYSLSMLNYNNSTIENCLCPRIVYSSTSYKLPTDIDISKSENCQSYEANKEESICIIAMEYMEGYVDFKSGYNKLIDDNVVVDDIGDNDDKIILFSAMFFYVLMQFTFLTSKNHYDSHLNNMLINTEIEYFDKDNKGKLILIDFGKAYIFGDEAILKFRNCYIDNNIEECINILINSNMRKNDLTDMWENWDKSKEQINIKILDLKKIIEKNESVNKMNQ